VMAGRKGPLLGIPLGYKDIYETAGVRTTAHSRSWWTTSPPRTQRRCAGCTQMVRSAMGKLATQCHRWAGLRPPYLRRTTLGRQAFHGWASSVRVRPWRGLVLGRWADTAVRSVCRPPIAALWPEADTGSGIAPRGDSAGAKPGHGGSDGLDCTGLCHPAGCARRP
jgi:hypothetical protein